jgi:exo-beta-1,3-glucanase (GH17 family)
MKAVVIFAVLIALVAASSSSSSSSKSSSSSVSSSSTVPEPETLPVLLFEVDTDDDDGGRVVTYDLISGQTVAETFAAFDGVDGADWLGLLCMSYISKIQNMY